MKSMQPHLLPYSSSAERVELLHNTVSYQQSYSGSETDVSTSTSTENLSHEEKYMLRTTQRQEPQGEENIDCCGHGGTDQPPSSFNTLIIHKNCASDDYYKRGGFLRSLSSASPSSTLHRGTASSSSVLYSTRLCSETKEMSDEGETEAFQNASIPYEIVHLPPPPAYTAGISADAFFDKPSKYILSRSQPDLTQNGNLGGSLKMPMHQRHKTLGRATLEKDHDIITARKMEMVDLVMEENASLKAELEIYLSKVTRLQKFEHELQKVSQSYLDLEKSSEKRDRLSRAVRMKLDLEVKRLQNINSDLKAQLDLATSQLCKRQSHELDDSELRRELNRRDVLIAQLITQNKELVATKERQDIELAAQRATLQEQRTHIDILDSALTNAQGNVVKLEEECRKKQVYVNRVEQLQKALTSLQMASNKREQMEKKLRAQQEKEIQELRKDGQCSYSGHDKDEVVELKRQLREHEEKMMTTQAEVSKWEQRYLEESAMRQIAIDAASMPKDAKIAALEQTSQESERLIAQGRLEKLKHMDEVHAINKKCADFEGRIKDLESKLAEKEAMIKVLQRHSIEKDFAFQNAILRSPRHTPHPSLHEKNFLSSPTTSDIGASSGPGCVTSLVTTISTLSITNTTASLTLAKTCSQIQESESENGDQLKDLDSELLSKDSIIHALRAEKEKYPNHFWRV